MVPQDRVALSFLVFQTSTQTLVLLWLSKRFPLYLTSSINASFLKVKLPIDLEYIFDVLDELLLKGVHLLCVMALPLAHWHKNFARGVGGDYR